MEQPKKETSVTIEIEIPVFGEYCSENCSYLNMQSYSEQRCLCVLFGVELAYGSKEGKYRRCVNCIKAEEEADPYERCEEY